MWDDFCVYIFIILIALFGDYKSKEIKINKKRKWKKRRKEFLKELELENPKPRNRAERRAYERKRKTRN